MDFTLCVTLEAMSGAAAKEPGICRASSVRSHCQFEIPVFSPEPSFCEGVDKRASPFFQNGKIEKGMQPVCIAFPGGASGIRGDLSTLTVSLSTFNWDLSTFNASLSTLNQDISILKYNISTVRQNPPSFA
ncbi:hypothetical protein JSY36_09290 [Bacillus sp. H-16]|uniref:hypothetical protein n=1 Tax=Alteribacter salitolerans TaxID=2912333 RepID=UPI0019666AAC|nr:hypothetical protein [Alteribacter salitolerans]MBM7095948.1 hypothetical protein [Alteribacter salitolerans]